MKNRYLGLIMALTILLSGASGFGGAYLLGVISNSPSAPYQEISISDAPAAADTGIVQTGVQADVFLASLDEQEEAQPETQPETQPEAQAETQPELALLNTQANEPGRQQLSIPQIAATASAAVVEIYTESVSNSGRMRQFVTEGAGSGVIISADGYIVTNNHVIEGSSRITVRLSNGKDHEAILIGRDSKTDLAVIKIDATGLQAATLGNSDRLVVGELAVAIGNPLGKLGGTVSEGIISALSRNIEIDGFMMDLLQTTAAVNPGNSGGGLFNSYGELIGIVNAKSSGTDIEGIGFAIPVNLARSITEALVTHGFVPGRIDFGATLINIPDSMTAMMYRVSATGVYVSQADPDSALRAGDRIISINGTEIKSAADVTGLLELHGVGDVLSVTVVRSGGMVTVLHTLKQAKT